MCKYKKGDKVVIRKDLEIYKWYGNFTWHEDKEYLKELDYVVINGVDEDGDYSVDGHWVENGWSITDEMIEGLYQDDKKYVWYLYSEDGTYFLNNLLGVDKWPLYGVKEIENGKDICYLLTEEEARKSPFFDKFKKHDPSEKWYYIRMKGNKEDYLNLNLDDDIYSMDDNYEFDSYKVKFTEEECDEIIGTSSILYKEECR